MGLLRPFTEVAWAASSPIQSEIQGRVLGAIGFRFDGTPNAATTIRTDAASRLLGLLEIVQNEDSRVTCEAEDLRLLCATINGGEEPQTSAATSTGFQAYLDFARMMPGAGIMPGLEKVFFRGTTGALADYAATPPSTFTGTVRVEGYTAPRVPLFRPDIRQLRKDLSTAGTDIEIRIPFDRGAYCGGIGMRFYDSSAFDRVDGLLKKLRVDVELSDSAAESGEMHRQTYQQARMFLKNRAGWSKDDVDNQTGWLFIPFLDDDDEPMWFERNSAIVLRLDTSSTAEGDVTSVTPGSGDECIVTIPKFFPQTASGVLVDRPNRAVARATLAQARALGARGRLRALAGQR